MPEPNPPPPLVPRLVRGWMRGPTPARYLLLSLLFIIVFQLSAALGATLVLRPGFIVWRPTVGVGVALLVIFGVRYLPALLVGVWLDALRIGGAGWAVRTGLLQTLLECAALLVLALLVRRVYPRGQITRLRALPVLFAVVLIGPVLLVPADVLRATVADTVTLGVAVGVEIWRGILFDWLADALGILLMVPLLAATAAPAVERWWRAARENRRLRRTSPGFPAELLLQALSIPAALALCYTLERTESFQGSYINFLPIFWIALRWGLPGATLASVSMAALAVYLLRFIQPGETRALEVQVMLLVLTTTGLLVGGGVSESRRAARALRKATAEDELLRRVADTANGARSLDEAVREVLRLVCMHTGWVAAHAYYVEGDLLTPASAWVAGGAGRLRRLRAPRRTARLAAGVGLAGSVLATGEAQWRSDFTVLAFPVRLQAQVVAVLEFISTRPEPPDARRLALMDAVGAQLGRMVERSRALEQLRDTNERLGQVLTSITDALLVFDAEGRISFANPRAEQIFGTSAEELLGSGAGDLFPGTDGALFRREYRRAEVEREPRHFEGYYAPREAWLELHLYPTREGLSIYFRDITHRKEVERRMEESEQRYRSLFHYNANAVYSVDFAGRFISANPACARVTGYPAEELLRMSLFELVVPEDRRRLEEAFHLAAREVTQVLDIGLVSAEGERVETSTTTVPIVVGGKIVGLFALSTDVTEQKRTEAALRESEERFRLMVEGSQQVFFYAYDRNRRFQYLSPSVKEVTGFEAAELIGRSAEVLFSLEPPTALAAEMLGRQARAAGKRAPQAARVAHRDGHFLTMELVESVVERGGEAVGTQGFARDVSERVELEEQLAHDAFHDSLTALPNRALFMDRLRHTSDLAQRQGVGLFAVLVLDLDRFKVINDSLGHEVGDQLLASVAQRLLRCVRPGDTVARFGGDEFVLLLEELREGSDATRVARRILRELSAPLALEGHEIFTDASIGIAFCSTDHVAPEELLRNADAAMYRAKNQGKGRYEVFDREMHSQAMQRLQVETDLRRAIERDELFVAYQPIVELDTREIVAFEALVRWRHPERGVLAPAAFIAVAEETGLISAIDHWVLRQACLQMREWEEHLPGPPLRLSVNLSGKQFAHPDFVERIREVLRETRANPALLRLEITEGVLVENAERAAAMLQELRELKIQFLIDDFGTGYSSLSYLQRLPIDTLKIDRSFVSGGDGEHKEIVQAVVSMAHSMNMGVVAEGMETPEQLERLQALRCDYGQGFLFSRPVAGDALEALLAGRG